MPAVRHSWVGGFEFAVVAHSVDRPAHIAGLVDTRFESDSVSVG